MGVLVYLVWKLGLWLYILVSRSFSVANKSGGRVIWGGRSRFGRYDSKNENLVGSLSSFWSWRHPMKDRAAVMSLLARVICNLCMGKGFIKTSLIWWLLMQVGIQLQLGCRRKYQSKLHCSIPDDGWADTLSNIHFDFNWLYSWKKGQNGPKMAYLITFSNLRGKLKF